MKATPGRIVRYRLSADDAQKINRRRDDFASTLKSSPHLGYIGHYGNCTSEGDVFPAMVIRSSHDERFPASLQVHLDGNDIFWAESRIEGTSPGTWAWPPRDPDFRTVTKEQQEAVLTSPHPGIDPMRRQDEKEIRKLVQRLKKVFA